LEVINQLSEPLADAMVLTSPSRAFSGLVHPSDETTVVGSVIPDELASTVASILPEMEEPNVKD
jgi:hypothetical protein